MSEFLITTDGVVLELVPSIGCDGCYFSCGDVPFCEALPEYPPCSNVRENKSAIWVEVKDEQ